MHCQSAVGRVQQAEATRPRICGSSQHVAVGKGVRERLLGGPQLTTTKAASALGASPLGASGRVKQSPSASQVPQPRRSCTLNANHLRRSTASLQSYICANVIVTVVGAGEEKPRTGKVTELFVYSNFSKVNVTARQLLTLLQHRLMLKP